MTLLATLVPTHLVRLSSVDVGWEMYFHGDQGAC